MTKPTVPQEIIDHNWFTITIDDYFEGKSKMPLMVIVANELRLMLNWYSEGSSKRPIWFAANLECVNMRMAMAKQLAETAGAWTAALEVLANLLAEVKNPHDLDAVGGKARALAFAYSNNLVLDDEGQTCVEDGYGGWFLASPEILEDLAKEAFEAAEKHGPMYRS